MSEHIHNPYRAGRVSYCWIKLVLWLEAAPIGAVAHRVLPDTIIQYQKIGQDTFLLSNYKQFDNGSTITVEHDV